MGRTELGADRMRGELAWGEPALRRNVWHPDENLIFEELSPQTSIIASLENSDAELRSSKGKLYKKPTLLAYRQGIQHYLQTYCPTIVSISSNPTGFSKVRGKHEFLLSLFILFTCALCVCFKPICTLYFSFVFISIWREIYTCMCLKCSVSTSTVYLGMTMEMKHQEYAVIGDHPPISEVDIVKLKACMSSRQVLTVQQSCSTR